MKKTVFSFLGAKIASVALLFLSTTQLSAQSPGDTIRVKTFKYGSTTRDTFIQFPTGNLTFEKIIMKYNMRCKNALISTQSAPNQGCGEWDYSCNTYLVDSSRIETDLNQAPKYVISNFNGSTFNYSIMPVHDYYNYTQTVVAVSSILTESQFSVGLGVTSDPYLLEANKKSGHSQILYTASELTTAGFSAGNIDAILLNVAGSAATVNFMKVRIQHTNQTALNAAAVTLSGFTTVFNSNYTFASGSNRIQFASPFVWNGTSNVLIDFSFTNTNPSTPLIFASSVTAPVTGLYASNNYAMDLSASGHVNINPTALSGITNELSIAFWVYGNSALINGGNSILYGTATNPNERQLNIHLPWNNNNVYFDCGYVGGGYDRIQKTTNAGEQGGQWHHWAFTKNASTGAMTIYLDGTVWMSGTAKTKATTILNLVLGKDKDLLNNYKGKMNELSIWNKELSQSDIQAWMKKPIDATHPFYTNLLAYYKMNEGAGLTITDSKNAATSMGVNLQWTSDRGQDLDRTFTTKNVRPNIVFLRGSYAMSTSTVTMQDVVPRNPNSVQQYSISSNAGLVPMAHDAVVLVSTTSYYEASVLNVYNGDTGILTSTIGIGSQGTLTMTNLPYYQRYPYYNELMSFVTPYGKGLDLGPTGKTWYFDMTDFTPIIKGKKRFLMTLGGETQEQMDIDFWFIVGTPPRNVVEFKQLWQGGARYGGVAIGSITSDTRFDVKNVAIPAAAESFKVRSTITGHGAQGEFGQNGGVVSHYLNVNGGPNEFTWSISMKCSFNPVFPQGGTWLYNRQGWCPGLASLLTENDITTYVTPGTTVNIDYNCSGPQIPSGDYRYIAAHQLVSYGAANHSVDAALLDVLAPSTKVLYSRTNPMCASPVILVRNTGANMITDMDMEYWVNTNASGHKETFQWTGNLGSMDTITINLPIGTLWANDLVQSNNVFHAEIKKVNGAADGYAFNNMYHSAFTLPDIITNQFTIEFKTNNNPFENVYRIVDETGLTIPGGSNMTTANTVYADSYDLQGCYKLIVEDYNNDGVSWWANTAQGVGYVRLKNAAGAVVKTFQPDFGGGFEYSFSTVQPNYVSINENSFAAGIKIYPNPAHDKFQVVANGLENADVRLTDLLGRTITVPIAKDKSGMVVDISTLKPGVFLVSMTKNNETVVKKIVVN